jgi:hypothetical protein
LSSLIILFYKHASALIFGDFSLGHLALAFLSLALTAVALVLLSESRRSLKIPAKAEAGEAIKA